MPLDNNRLKLTNGPGGGGYGGTSCHHTPGCSARLQLNLVLSGRTRKGPGLHGNETATATDGCNGPRQRTPTATACNDLARQRTRPAATRRRGSKPGGRVTCRLPRWRGREAGARAGNGASTATATDHGNGEAKRRTTLNRAVAGEPRAAPPTVSAPGLVETDLGVERGLRCRRITTG